MTWFLSSVNSSTDSPGSEETAGGVETVLIAGSLRTEHMPSGVFAPRDFAPLIEDSCAVRYEIVR